MAKRYFTNAALEFLSELADNNRRKWFEANRQRYENDVRDPALRFVADFGPRLTRISREFVADPRPSGGSLFRIHRDVRFSRDKSPYKTHIGIRFPHRRRKDVHAPGYYLHIEPGDSFVGVGVWRPSGESLTAIRDAIVEEPTRWKRARNARRFREAFELAGESLKTQPRGYESDHPLIVDLRRKDFIGVCPLEDDSITGRRLLETFEARCRAAGAFQRFLCGAVGVAY